MRIVKELSEIQQPFKNAVITIGNFDGVHIGHQALLHTVIETADRIGGTSVAMTFDPHPMRILSENAHLPLITMPQQKAELIEKAGIEVLIVVPFTHGFAQISAHDFVAQLLLKRIGMRAIVVGKDYTFGKRREGNLPLLKRWSRSLNFEVLVLDWIQGADDGSDRISSTHIRQSVMDGRMAEAKRMLGRNYQIRGVVAGGRNRGGRLLGFPTANINLQDELCPQQGIYAVTVVHDERTYPGVANIGYSPTFDDHLFTVEVHILNFNQDIYGHT
ncbi:MAG: riboflavin biosynthesis protein RibF, partial [Desulfatitalea sp.]|nr:riboflavin biosynthesis protein RibF [Desulfatitalea sp.]NNK00436.1 riboflavin biosynthesis protein RibF [Desulfatitalea sp.]